MYLNSINLYSKITYLLFCRPELLSDSEFEESTSSNVVVPQKLVSRGNIVGTQSSIRLSELGPRLTLQVKS